MFSLLWQNVWTSWLWVRSRCWRLAKRFQLHSRVNKTWIFTTYLSQYIYYFLIDVLSVFHYIKSLEISTFRYNWLHCLIIHSKISKRTFGKKKKMSTRYHLIDWTIKLTLKPNVITSMIFLKLDNELTLFCVNFSSLLCQKIRTSRHRLWWRIADGAPVWYYGRQVHKI